MKLTLFVTLATLLAIPLHGQGSKKHPEEGASIFKEQCAGCHGEDG